MKSKLTQRIHSGGLILTALLVTAITSQAQQAGELWGMTYSGGSDNRGTIFKTAPDGTDQTVQMSFSSQYSGANPLRTQLTEAPNGKLYGMTQQGGANNAGVLFEYSPASRTYLKVFDFYYNSGAFPIGSLTLASNGKLYGTTIQGGASGAGVLFEFDPVTASYSKKLDFDYGGMGGYPQGGLTEVDGKLYGMTTQGGINGVGVLFEFDPVSSSYSKKIDFNNSIGTYPYGSLTMASNGKLYGLTSSGGANSTGVLFEYDPVNDAFSPRFDFALIDYSVYPYSNNTGGYPYGSLTEGDNGKLYGMTQQGGLNGNGVIFEYSPSDNSFTRKFDFNNSSGGYPMGSLTKTSTGEFFGMTTNGGVYSAGVLFEFEPTENGYVIKKEFNINDGVSPQGSPMEASNGKIYGLTTYGGSAGQGTLFEYDYHEDAFSSLLSFNSYPNGANPYGSLAEAPNGKLYGLTHLGGNNNAGVLFEFDPVSATYAKKLDFDYNALGGYPFADLTLGPNGKFYGTTVSGGANGQGVLFEFDPALGTYSKKLDFDYYTNGSNPYASLTLASNGKLYGVTFQGGTNGFGVLFEFDPGDNSYSRKFEFEAIDYASYPYKNNSGAYPFGGLMQAVNGKLYGMTVHGGVNGYGVLYEFDLTSNTYSKKQDFDSQNGTYGYGSLTEVNGKLYGMTAQGGIGYGVLFEYNPSDNTYTKKKDFDYNSGVYPYGGLTLGSGGKLFGMIGSGGNNGQGVVFEYSPADNTLTKKLDFTGANGANPYYGHLTVLGGVQIQQQTITFNALPSKTDIDLPFELTATASSGLLVTYSSSDTTVATVSGSTVAILNTGTTTITASQAGNAYYLPAADVQQTLSVLPAKVNEADSLSLVAFYNSTFGANWNNKTNWLTGAVNTWYGVMIDKGRVSQINLPNNNVRGAIPDLSTLTELTRFDISNNTFLTGTFPASITGLSQLQTLLIQGCNFNALPPNTAWAATSLYIDLSNNSFDFGDLEPLASLSFLTITNTGQRAFTLYQAVSTTAPIKLFVGESFSLTPTVPGTQNSYQWYVNNSPLSGANSLMLDLGQLAATESGTYRLQVSNGIVTSVMLNSVNLIISVVGPAENLFRLAHSSPVVTDVQANSNGGHWADYDQDGDEDLFVNNSFTTVPNFLYENDGGGNFQKITTGEIVTLPEGGRYASWGDYNNDGYPDIFVGEYFTGTSPTADDNVSSLYKNNGDKTFTRIPFNHKADGGVWVDYDNDGDLDLTINSTNAASVGNMMYRNNGDETFELLSNFFPVSSTWYVGWLDVDNDGDQDYNITSGLGQIKIFRNNGDGTFAEENLTVPAGFNHRGSSWGDIDGDGDMDLFAMSAAAVSGAASQFYINDGTGHFTMINAAQRLAGFAGFGGRGSSFGDMDNDGDLDLVLIHRPTLSTADLITQLFLNNGNGIFSPVSQGQQSFGFSDFASGISLADYDNRGDLDIFIGSFEPARSNYLFQNIQSNRNSVRLKLVGSVSNKSAIGARVKVYANGKLTSHQVMTSSGLSGQNSSIVHTGLGGSYPRADSVIIYWPSGIVQKKRNVSSGLHTIDEQAIEDQTISFNALDPKTYGDAPFELMSTATSGLAVTFTSSDATIASIAGNQVTILRAGSVTITASQAGNESYYPAQDVQQILAINKAILTVTADDKAITYGDDFPVFTLTITGFIGNDEESTIDVAPKPVFKAGLEAAAAKAAPRDRAGTVTSSPQFLRAGEYGIGVIEGIDDNYDFSYNIGVLTINKAVLTATADNKTRNVWEVNPELTISFNGFKGTEDVTYLDAMPTASTLADTSSPTGNYPILVSGGSAINYEIILIDGWLTISKLNQSINFDPLADKTYGNAPFELTATTNSGLPVSYISSDPAVASIAGSTVTILKAGWTAITASQAGDDNYLAAEPVQQTLTVSKASQAIRFDPLPTRTFGDPAFEIKIYSSSLLPLSFIVDDPTVATISLRAVPDRYTITILKAGTTKITASQEGNENYLPAENVGQTLTVKKANQTLSGASQAANHLVISEIYGGGGLAGATTGDYIELYNPTNAPIDVRPMSIQYYLEAQNRWVVIELGRSSNTRVDPGKYLFISLSNPIHVQPDIIYGLNISETSGMVALCNTIRPLEGISPSNRDIIDFVGYGTPAAGGFEGTGPATAMSATTSIERKASASSTSSTMFYGGTDEFNGNGYDSNNNVDDFVLRTKPGPQSSSTGGEPSTSSSWTLSDKTYGDAPFTLDVTASSGLPVTYFSSNTNVATINGNMVTITGAGTTRITADQAGDNNYNGIRIETDLSVLKAGQIIAFTALDPKTYGDEGFDLEATSTSGLTVAFTSSDITVATVSGSTVTILGAGTTTITASQAGNENYLAANVQQDLVINKATLTATADDKTITYGDDLPPFTINYSGFVGGEDASVIDEPSVAELGIIPDYFNVIGVTPPQFIRAGSYQIQVNPGIDNNYEISRAYPYGYLTINKATLTATADDKNKYVGDANPELTISYSGFKGTEDVTHLIAAPTVSTTVDESSLEGTYSITLSGGVATNYNFVVVDGTLAVIKKEQAITFYPLPAKSYRDVPFVLTATSSSGLMVNYVSSDPTVASISGETVTILKSGTTIITASQSGNDFYYAAMDVPQTLTVSGVPIFIINPLDGSIDQDISLTVASQGMPGPPTSDYTIELSPLLDFSSGVISRYGSRTQDFTGLAYSTRYYARAKTDASPEYGKTTSFTTASPEFLAYVVNPVNGTVNTNVNIRVTSHEVIGATAYTIEISPDNTFTSGVLSSGTGSSLFYDFTGLSYNTTYYARVRTDLSPNYGRVTSFTTAPSEFFAFVTNPSDGALNANVNMNATSNTVSGASAYTIELSTYPTFPAGYVLMNVGNISITQPFGGLALSTTYYARVKTNLSANYGRTTSFTTGDALNLSYVTSPADGDKSVTRSVTVFANIVTGATNYIIELNTSPNFVGGTSFTNSSSTNSMAFSGLAGTTTYYTRVQTNLTPGQWGNTVTSFKTGKKVGSARSSGDVILEEDILAPGPLLARAYPNPFQNKLVIHLRTLETEVITIHLYDLNGKETVQQEGNTNSLIGLETGQLASGMYLLKAVTKEGIVIKKVLKE